ncbi:MAG: glycosyltransferase family 2 protein [Peptostreptococcaceae bacterium]
MNKLSLVMIVKNEDTVLDRCLSSSKDYVDEIIIVDTGSTDKTLEIAKKYDAKIFNYEWSDSFSDARNFAISKSSGDFNLILDADEYIVKFDRNKINSFMNNYKNHIGCIKLIDSFEKDNSIQKNISFISRFAPKNTFYEGIIHEQLDPNLDRIKIPIEIEHDGYLYVNKSDRNIKLILKELEQNPNNSYMNYQAAKTYYTNKEYEKASVYFDKYYLNSNYKKDAFYTDSVILNIYNSVHTKEFDDILKVVDDNLEILNNRCDFYFACGVLFTEMIAHNPNKYGHFLDNIRICYENSIRIGEDDNFDGVVGTGSFLSYYNLSMYYKIMNDLEIENYYLNLYNKTKK